jgi:type IV fimbrial biogenesis protein FimT
MLSRFSKKRLTGFTIIELMVVVTVMSILAGIALPSYNAWMRSIQIRNAGQAIVNGLQKARGEAISRNSAVEFKLGTASSWTVGCVTTTATCPNPIESRDASDGSKDVTVVAVNGATAATKVTFNSFGRVVSNPDGSVSINKLTLSAVNGGKNMQVSIGVGGDAKMCDPSLTAGTSPQAC